MAADVVIRDATPEDADGIAAVHIASWRQHYRHVFSTDYLDGPMSDEKRAFWEKRLRSLDEGDVVLCAAGVDRVLGVVTAAPDQDLVRGAYIFALHVSDDAKGQGVGRRLMAETARRLSALGMEQVWLHVFTANRDAIRFYERLEGVRGLTRWCDQFGDKRVKETTYHWRDLAALADRADPSNRSRRAVAVRAADTGAVVGADHPVAIVEKAMDRSKQRLGDVFGLDQYGVNRVTLEPGVWSTVRHWHSHEEEFVYVLAGALVLVTDRGETALREGDCAGFKAGVPDGHRLENRSDAPAVYLEVGSRRPDVDEVTYSDEDLVIRFDVDGRPWFMRRDGTKIKPAD